MKTYFNIETQTLALSAGSKTPLAKVNAKLGAVLDIEVIPSVTLAEGSTGAITAKLKGTYTGDILAMDSTWDSPAEPGEGYLLSTPMTGTDLAALFIDEKPEISLMAEITIVSGGKILKSQTFEIVVARNIWAAGDTPPATFVTGWPVGGRELAFPPLDEGAVPSVRLTPSGHLALYNPDTLGWHTLTISGAAGSETINIGPFMTYIGD